jgi:hypothetical protein
MPRGYRKNNITMAEAFEQLEKAAVAGARCPITGTNGLTSNLTGALARSGQIRIDVYPHNWRVVTIMTGPNAGRATAPPPNKHWKPYLTIQKDSPLKPSYTRISP